MATRTGSGSAGNGLGNLPVSTAEPEPSAGRNTDGDQYGEQEYSTEVVYSGSDQDSDSGDDEDAVGSGGDRRGVKRERSEDGRSAKSSGGLNRAYSGGSPAVSGAKPGKKTRGRVKIKMEFIDNKLRRYTTFSKRKTGIMKKVSVEETHQTGKPKGFTFPEQSWISEIPCVTESRTQWSTMFPAQPRDT
ncbi:hypothetical protein GOODEAATRI_028281 [Goodea atripinnis]|uniref:MADS-box domain-containing protein n=1 Tax=Goodea atripinnis TaxID=208336 RepID=A0ABV0N6A5_9TELE